MDSVERRRSKSDSGFLENKIYLCVDDDNSTSYSGRIFHSTGGGVELFSGVDQLLLKIEGILDKKNFPAASTESRYFRKPLGRDNIDEKEENMENRDKGEKATFVVQVQYRQNATWQGHVTWVEKDIERPFRSALELIKLLDSSYDGEPE